MNTAVVQTPSGHPAPGAAAPEEKTASSLEAGRGAGPLAKKVIAVWVLAVAALLCLTVWEWGIQTLTALTFRYGRSYTEGVLTAAILRVGSFPLIYGDWNQSPFVLMPYNPLYAYLAYGISLISGPGFFCGRLVGLGGCVGTMVLSFLILRRAGAPRLASAAVCAFPLLIPIINKNTCHVVPDYPATFFSFLGLYAVLRLEDSKLKRFFFLGVAAFALSVFTKQNYVWAASAYALTLLGARRWRDFLMFSAALAAAVGVPMLILNGLTQGHYFNHVFFSPSTIRFYRVDLFFGYWKSYLADAWMILPLVALALPWAFRRGPGRLVWLYFALTLLSSSILGKVGSGDNYFIEINAIACVLCGLAFAPAGSGVVRSWRGAAAHLLVLAVFLSGAAGGYNLSYARAAESNRKQEKDLDELGPVIRNAPGEVLCENLGLLIANGREVVYEPFEFAQLTYLGRFDERIILRKIQNHDYGLMLLSTNIFRVAGTSRFTPAFIRFVKQFYRPAAHKHGQFLFVPAKP